MDEYHTDADTKNDTKGIAAMLLARTLSRLPSPSKLWIEFNGLVDMCHMPTTVPMYPAARWFAGILANEGVARSSMECIGLVGLITPTKP